MDELQARVAHNVKFSSTGFRKRSRSSLARALRVAKMVVASSRVRLQLAGALRTPHSVNDEIIWSMRRRQMSRRAKQSARAIFCLFTLVALAGLSCRAQTPPTTPPPDKGPAIVPTPPDIPAGSRLVAKRLKIGPNPKGWTLHPHQVVLHVHYGGTDRFYCNYCVLIKSGNIILCFSIAIHYKLIRTNISPH